MMVVLLVYLTMAADNPDDTGTRRHGGFGGGDADRHIMVGVHLVSAGGVNPTI